MNSNEILYIINITYGSYINTEHKHMTYLKNKRLQKMSLNFEHFILYFFFCLTFAFYGVVS